MPRNGSSVYSLPAGNPVIPGTIISTTWANTTLTDIATALTNSLSTDGSTASVSMAGKTMAGGTYSAPSVTGILTLTGGQIAFPAVAIPSANANTLDDYEEGTWTPTLTATTPGNLNVVYTNRIGTYTKVGNLVRISVIITTSTYTHTTASGTNFISGLPFAANNNSPLSQAIGLSDMSGITMTSPLVLCGGRIDSANTLIRFTGSNFTTGNVSDLTITGNTLSGTQQSYRLGGTYLADT